MNVNFKLIWFEDLSEVFEAFRPEILGKIANYKLIPNVIEYKSSTYSISELASADLVLADYDLGTSNSVDIVAQIRSNNITTDVLLYSAQEKKMLDKIRESSPIEGIFYVKRGSDTLLPKIDLLIQRIIRRSQTIENLRGLVMEYTAVFDKNIYENILNFCNDTTTKALVLQYINNDIPASAKERVCKSCRNCHPKKYGCDNIKQFASNEIADITQIDELDSYSKCRILGYILKSRDPEKYKNFVKDYNNEVIKYRNAFAHEKSDGNRIFIRGTKTYENIDDALFNKIRQIIIKYEKFFKDIKE